jgi:histidine ammonia-lyase
MQYIISSKRLSLKALSQIDQEVDELSLSGESIALIEKSRSYLDTNFGDLDSTPTYGINTGFGSLCDTGIAARDLQQLQHNLIMSHACGTGDEVPQNIVRWMLFLKIQSLSYGHSGVSLELVKRLMGFFNQGIYPVIYEQGSLGASGDLAPLAHLALPLIGLGHVNYKGKVLSGKEINDKMGWESLKLQSKEGLALINGTQFMLAYGIDLVLRSHRLMKWAHITAALAIDGFNGNSTPYDERIHLIRPHKGQLKSAAEIRDLLEGSEIAASEKVNVQDPYSLRCVPQVHGATYDTLDFVTKTIVTEANSVTDNPNIFVDSEAIISGGNFHGQPLALALDYISIAMSEIGNISERRTFQLLSGKRGLPVFLSENPGLHSGMMIIQYTAASIVSQNKQLANPSSIDSIVSSNGQEDHVSMGANAATKAKRVIDNVTTVLAIELIAAAQAVDYRDKKTSPFLQSIISLLRIDVTHLTVDRVMHDDIIAAKTFIEQMSFETDVLFD